MDTRTVSPGDGAAPAAIRPESGRCHAGLLPEDFRAREPDGFEKPLAPQ